MSTEFLAIVEVYVEGEWIRKEGNESLWKYMDLEFSAEFGHRMAKVFGVEIFYPIRGITSTGRIVNLD